MLCPICNQLASGTKDVSLSPSEAYNSPPSGEVERLGFCLPCDVHFSPRYMDVSPAQDLKNQALVNYNFYKARYDDSEFSRNLEINSAMLQSFAKFCRHRELYVEIGVGLGMLTRAASTHFGKCVGLDLEVETALSIGNVPNNVAFKEHNTFIEENREHVSAIAAWHVLEHLTDPHAVLRPLLTQLAEGGVFFGQVPLLRPEYVIEAHYIFYTETALSRLMKAYGLHPIYFERDEVNQFLSFSFRRKFDFLS